MGGGGKKKGDLCILANKDVLYVQSIFHILHIYVLSDLSELFPHV